jgi:hypothetical protein
MPQTRLAEVPMDVWHKSTPADDVELRRSPRPVLAHWVSGQDELTLYEDGKFESIGFVPVELLPLIEREWHNSLRGRIA